MGRSILLPARFHPDLKDGDPRVLPEGERIRGNRHPDSRGQHGQQIFPPGVDQPGTWGVDLPPPCRFYEAGFAGVWGSAGKARGRASGDVYHRSEGAHPRVYRSGPDCGPGHRRNPEARLCAPDRKFMPCRLASWGSGFTATPEKQKGTINNFSMVGSSSPSLGLETK